VADLPEPNAADDASASVPGLPDIDVGGLLGGADMGGLLAQAQDMLAAQAAAAEQEVEGVAGGGVVRIRATGTGQVLSVHLEPEAVDPDDIAMLEDLILAALHDVNARLAEVQRAALGPLAALGDLFGGTDDVDADTDDEDTDEA
jgi:DNA-binding YbaB/EbfC family protein